MYKLLVFIALFGLALAKPQFFPGFASHQYRYQDGLGQHAFGHVGGPNSREEVKTADGVTRGSYSYVDGYGLVQSAIYKADGAGFRVAATNPPVGPAVPAGHPVAAVAPVAYPSAILSAPVVHALKKRDVFAVNHPFAFAAPYHAGAFPVPADEPVVAHAKAAHLIQQHTEAVRNSVGGVPLALPADTPEVAAGKAAHAVAYAHEAARNSHPYAHHAFPFTHVLKKRAAVLAPFAAPLAAPYHAVHAIHAGAFPVPADEPIVAHAKAAHLIQQHTEAVRNSVGGVPLALPADTPEVAAGKAAHAVAYAHEAARNSHPYAHHAFPFAHVLKKRAAVLAPFAAPLAAPYHTVHAIHAGAFPVPADEPIVAHAKAAQLIQQHTEGVRNNVGGVPLALPADTPEVAAGKIAHSIAHAHEAAKTSHPYYFY